MQTRIKLRRNFGKLLQANDYQLGELALDLTNNRVLFLNSPLEDTSATSRSWREVRAPLRGKAGVITHGKRAPDSDLKSGDIWYDETNSILMVRNKTVDSDVWEPAGTNAAYTAPVNPKGGTIWYDKQKRLYKFWDDTPGYARWTQAGVTADLTAPLNPEEGTLWYDTDDADNGGKVLKVYSLIDDGAGPVGKWIATKPSSTSTPPDPDTVTRGTTWFDLTTETLLVWDGTAWKPAGNPPSGTVEPTNVAKGSTWFDENNNQLLVYNGTSWQSMGVIVSATAPTGDGVANGNLWWDTTTKVLKIRNAALNKWVDSGLPQASATAPASPEKGQWWYDSVGNVMMYWNGTEWISGEDINIDSGSSSTFHVLGAVPESGILVNVKVKTNFTYNQTTNTLTVPNVTSSGTNTSNKFQINGTDVIDSSRNLQNIANATSANTANTYVMRDGSGNFTANIMTGTATRARYADLAEKYLADKEYEVGTVMSVGGSAEVTATDLRTQHSIIGVVSGSPAYMMNSELEGGTYIALKGRVPVKVIGHVLKGDRLAASTEAGKAMADNSILARTFAIALTDSHEGKVEAIIL